MKHEVFIVFYRAELSSTQWRKFIFFDYCWKLPVTRNKSWSQEKNKSLDVLEKLFSTEKHINVSIKVF